MHNHYVAGTSDHYNWDTNAWANGDHILAFTIPDGVGKSVSTSFLITVAH